METEKQHADFLRINEPEADWTDIFLSPEMVNLDSYDSEGPLTPETDDSTEVRSGLCVDLSSSLVFISSPHLSTLFLLLLTFKDSPAKVLVALSENVCFIC